MFFLNGHIDPSITVINEPKIVKNMKHIVQSLLLHAWRVHLVFAIPTTWVHRRDIV